MERDELLDVLIRRATHVFEATPVFLAYAHGSRIEGNPRAASDLDVGYYLVDYARGATLPIRHEMALADRLSGGLGVEVDLRNLGLAPLEVRGRVLEDGVRIFCDDEVGRVDLERDLLGRYHDYKETFRRLHAGRLKSISESGL